MGKLTDLWIKTEMKRLTRKHERNKKIADPKKKRKILIKAIKDSPISELDETKLTKKEQEILNNLQETSTQELEKMVEKLIKAMKQFLTKKKVIKKVPKKQNE